MVLPQINSLIPAEARLLRDLEHFKVKFCGFFVLCAVRSSDLTAVLGGVRFENLTPQKKHYCFILKLHIGYFQAP